MDNFYKLKNRNYNTTQKIKTKLIKTRSFMNGKSQCNKYSTF